MATKSALPSHMKNGGADTSFDKERHHGKSQSHVVSFQHHPRRRMWQEKDSITATIANGCSPPSCFNALRCDCQFHPPSPLAAPPSSGGDAGTSPRPINSLPRVTSPTQRHKSVRVTGIHVVAFAPALVPFHLPVNTYQEQGLARSVHRTLRHDQMSGASGASWAPH